MLRQLGFWLPEIADNCVIGLMCTHRKVFEAVGFWHPGYCQRALGRNGGVSSFVVPALS